MNSYIPNLSIMRLSSCSVCPHPPHLPHITGYEAVWVQTLCQIANLGHMFRLHLKMNSDTIV